MVDTNGKAQLPQGGRFNQTEVESKRYTVRNQIDFDKTWKDHAVTAIAGLEFRENKIPTPARQLLYGYDPQTLTSDFMNWQTYRDGVGTSALSGRTITLSGLSATLHESRHRYASFMQMQDTLICHVIIFPEVYVGIKLTCSGSIYAISAILCGQSVLLGFYRKNRS